MACSAVLVVPMHRYLSGALAQKCYFWKATMLLCYYATMHHMKNKFFRINQLRIVRMLLNPEDLNFIHTYQKQLAITLQRCSQELTAAQLIDAYYFTQKHYTYHLFSWSGSVSNKLESRTNFSLDFSRYWIISLKCILLLLRNKCLYIAR